MAKRAEQAGLGLDWTCLPAGGDPLGPMHDSSSGIFVIDRLHPTFRELCNIPAKVSFYQRLYAPHDDNGNRLDGLNQSVHSSVIARLGKQVDLRSLSFPVSTRQIVYDPVNLNALIEPQTGKSLAAVRIMP